jgi:RNA polymerase sigma-70 factor (ECF subfamily)
MELDLLVNQFQQKNVKAFETLYQMYHKSILGVIQNIVRDSNIAEEVTQDVFIKVWHNSAAYDGSKGRFFTWIINIARNAAIDKTRAKSFKNEQKNVDVGLFADFLETEDSLDEQTNSIGIAKFVNKLAEKCKEIIDAIYFRGYTQQEASETLAIPLGTVKTRSRSCIGELREMLED